MKVTCKVTDTFTLSREEVLDAIGATVNAGDMMSTSFDTKGALVIRITRVTVETEMPARVGDDPWKRPGRLYDRDCS